MNAEHNALVKDLIDSAHPHNPHEACEAALEFSIHSDARGGSLPAALSRADGGEFGVGGGDRLDGDAMKTLTLTEPWASLVAIGAKRIETRCWKTSYRGQLAIHSAKGFPRYAKEMLSEPHVYNSWAQFGLKQKFPGRAGCGFPHGCVIAITTLLDCVPTEAIADHPRWGEMVNAREAFLGDYTPGRFAWILGTPVEIEPIPAKGALSLWEWNREAQSAGVKP